MKRFSLFIVLSLFLTVPSVTKAQDIICCNLLIGYGGDWFGAIRECEEILLQSTKEQQFHVCSQFSDYPSYICSEVTQYCDPCDGSEPKKNNPKDKESLGPESPFMQGLVDGLDKYGISYLEAEHIAVQDKRKKQGLIKYQIRLDSNGCILPTAACVLFAGSQGKIPQGVQEGAKRMLIGSIQIAGNTVKVAARIVNVETGVIEDAGTATSKKRGRKNAIAEAFSKAMNKLDMSCYTARALNFK